MQADKDEVPQSSLGGEDELLKIAAPESRPGSDSVSSKTPRLRRVFWSVSWPTVVLALGVLTQTTPVPPGRSIPLMSLPSLPMAFPGWESPVPGMASVS